MSKSLEKGFELLYGRKGVAELLRRAPKRIQRVLLAEDVKLPQELQTLLTEALPASSIERRPREELQELCENGVHQGILAYIRPQEELAFKDFLRQLPSPSTETAPIVILDQINDPHNFGAILRVADAAGVTAVLYTSARSSGVTPLVRKASAGASEFVKLVKLKNLQQSLSQLKEKGYWIVGTEVHGDSALLYETEIPSPHAIVFGREGEGLRELTIKQCDMLVHLPMRGSVESLNVSQAASIVLYELLRRQPSESS